MDKCYCGRKLSIEEANRAFKCESCSAYFHFICTKSQPPSHLLGDIFYEFTCLKCACKKGAQSELFKRIKLTWLQVIVLTLYNLEQTCDQGMLGHFKWKEHVCAFIQQHWHLLFYPSVKRTHKWQGTVAGVLSSYANLYFSSGMSVLKQSGWWGLADAVCPSWSLSDPPKLKRNQVEANAGGEDSPQLESPLKSHHRVADNNGKQTKKFKASSSSTQLQEKTADAFEKQTDDDDNNGDNDEDDDDDVIDVIDVGSYNNDVQILQPYDDANDNTNIKDKNNTKNNNNNNNSKLNNGNRNTSDISSSATSDNVMGGLDETSQLTDTSSQDSSNKELCNKESSNKDRGNKDSRRKKPRSVHWKTGQGLIVEDQVPEFFLKDDEEEDDDDEESNFNADDLSSHRGAELVAEEGGDDDDTKGNLPPLEQLFPPFEQKYDRPVPPAAEKALTKRQSMGEVSKSISNTHATSNSHLTLMSRYDERVLLRRLHKLQGHCHSLASFNLLTTKLLLKQRKRQLGVAIFNIDSYMSSLSRQDQRQQQSQALSTASAHNELLDRYQHSTKHERTPEQEETSFVSRLIGSEHLRSIRSPYSNKLLKPYIRRDVLMRPMKLRLLQEIVAHAHRGDDSWQAPASAPIDFVHVRPQHIGAINHMCHQFFWPGVDLSESLLCPECSVVALYKNLVVAFAFMIPDVGVDECYLSFVFTHPEWRRAGIAKFMLFYLLQLEPHKDVTLHVSVSNQALLLYQNFCFKVEEYIVNFYDKYLPFESTECRNAFFMRFKRFV